MAQPRSILSERAIRNALLVQLRASAHTNDLLIEELGIEHGSARVDVAVVTDQLQGYEIKSDFDTLDRLARQMHAYHRVFDALTIVTTPTFADQVEALLPQWWGILLAQEDDEGTIHLAGRRTAKAHGRQEAISLAALLWRDEAYAFVLEQLGPIVKPRAPRADLYEAIAADVTLPRIRERVLATLRTREALRHRLHVTSNELADGIDEVMVRGIAAPCHETA